MNAEDRAAVKGGLTDTQFDALLRAIRETVRAEIRAEFEGRREAEAWFASQVEPAQRVFKAD